MDITTVSNRLKNKSETNNGGSSQNARIMRSETTRLKVVAKLCTKVAWLRHCRVKKLSAEQKTYLER